jgi:uncharacterized protein YbbC (DUF1343 family)/CubicO group peptidase (beta-lactamase class C family)
MSRSAAVLAAIFCCITVGPGTAADRPLPVVAPESLGLSAEALAKIDTAVREALDRGDCPGVVVVVVHRGAVVYRKAFGQRSLEPAKTQMLPEIVFDLASLTKPIATSTSIMLLVEQGKLKVSDPLGLHIPAFRRKETEGITLEHLLTHTSGFIADNPVSDYKDGPEKAWQRLHALDPVNPPGSKFTYSDVNYILLGEVIEKLSGMPLDVFARKHIFEPLGLNETGFRPQGKLKERAAPTEKRGDTWMMGEVHDPRAYALGGVAGHAGLFSTADDLAVYSQMLLSGGAYDGKRILKAETVTLMTAPREVPLAGNKKGLRTYGWDMQTSYSSNRGDVFPSGVSFGHTGFTGTSLWIDPASQTAVIVLANKVHPNGKGNVIKLRGQVATLAARAVQQAKTGKERAFKLGLDVLVDEGFVRLKGKKVGLITNHTGLDSHGRATIDLLHQAPGVQLVALFSPEHGIRGAVDEKVTDSKDEKTGLPIYSLYGERRKPTAATLKGIDTLVFDIQDVGCRFYTYTSTMGLAMEAAAENKLRIVVLDRPNPIGGLAVEGPVLDEHRESFVGYHRLPIRYGLTIGELALLVNKERKIGADLDVVKLQGWKRGDLYDVTGLTWVNPSPNLRSFNAALTYPGIGLLETTNLSVGRGTERPFEWIGAPWLEGRKLAEALAGEKLPGVRWVPQTMTPAASVFKGERCDGVQIIVDDWTKFQPVKTGLAVAVTLRCLYPEAWKVKNYDRLLIHKSTFDALQAGATWQELEKNWQPGLEAFLQVRRQYLVYAEQ